MFMGEATRLSDWFGSFWVKQSDGSRKVIHCAGNEFTQVSVRSRVVQDGGASGGDIQLLTTRKATTYQHLSAPASEVGDAASGGAKVTTLGKELHVLPSITWSPLPPRRAAAAAAQSLCVTLYCDDTLDEIKDITSRMVTATTTTTATATSKTVGGDLAAVTRAFATAAAAANASSKMEVTTIRTTNKPPANQSREGHNYHVAFQNPIAATMSNATLPQAASVFSSTLVNPYVSLNATPSLGKRNLNIDEEISSSDVLGMNLYPPLDTPSPPSSLAQTQMRPSMMNYNSPLDNTHSPMHISHTPYSPPLGAQRAPLQPPPLSFPSTALIFPQYSNRPKFNTIGSSSKRHSKPMPNRNTVDGVNIASLCTPASVTDASLTAHLPPWHSIGNISLSYQQQLSSSNEMNQNQRTTNDDCRASNDLRHRSKSRTCPCFPHPCERVHPSCHDTATRPQHHVITNQNDVLRVESTQCYPVVHSSPTPSTAVPHATAKVTRSPVHVSKSLVLPLEDSQQPLPPSTLHSAMTAMNGTTTTGLKKNLSFASPPDNKQAGVFPLTGLNAAPVTTTASAATPISPSDSVLSTGFYVSPSSSVPQKPCTHPRDTPTHQPSSVYSPPRKIRTQADPSAHDLRLDSIHDLTWLNAMEPEDQVMLEVHVIWSLLTLMVVLLACYSVHHNPLSG